MPTWNRQSTTGRNSIENESKLLEDHRKENKEILIDISEMSVYMMSRNEGVVFVSNGWVKGFCFWIFCVFLLYTSISIVLSCHPYIDK